MRFILLALCCLAGCQRSEPLGLISCVRTESETCYLRSDGIVVIVSPSGFIDKLPVYCVSKKIVEGFCRDLDSRKHRTLASPE